MIRRSTAIGWRVASRRRTSLVDLLLQIVDYGIALDHFCGHLEITLGERA